MKYKLNEDLEYLYSISQDHLILEDLIEAEHKQRKTYKLMNKDKEITYEKITLTGWDSKEFSLFVIRPVECDKNCPVILLFHGGAFVYKGFENHFKLSMEYAKRTKSIVIYVDYSLAHNTKYLHTKNDCILAYEWVIQNKDKYFYDLDKLIFLGDSAGAYLALLVSTYAKKRILPCALVLIYPLVDPSMRTESMKKYTDTPIWNSVFNKEMWDYYLKGYIEESYLDMDLSYIKNCYIETCEYDCLHDEGILLSKKIKNCYLFETLGTPHGYDIDLNTPTTKNAIQERVNYILKVTKS